MRSIALRLLLACSLVLLPVGCSTESDPAAAAVLNVGATGEPDGLDPSTVSGAGTAFVLLYNVYETLVRLDGQGNIVPLLATDWQVSADNRTYTFNLNPAAKFASGEQVTAQAVATSFQRILDGTGTDTVKGQWAPVEEVVVVDEGTLEVKLKQASNRWLYDMTGIAGIVYDPAGLETLNTAPAGSGPYEFVAWDQGNYVQLKTNPDYWGDKPEVSEVYFRFFADPNAMNTAMLSGELDVISNLTVPDSIGQFEGDDRFQVLEGSTDGEVVLGFNHQNEALQELRVRQAINHAIDRKALVAAVWGGKGQLIGSMVPPTDPWYTDLADTYPYDPARAKQLLAEAGYADGLQLRLRVPTLPYGPSAGRFVATQLEEVGIDVVLDELEFPARWLDLVYTAGDYDLTIVAHVEPRDIVKFAEPEYYWHYDNPEFAKLIGQADSADAESYVKLMGQASAMLAEDAAADWLFLLPNLIITTKQVGGIEANATNLSFDLTHVTIER
ncbi:MAG: ABC transporter substrate-binding protein [Arachnia propionica]|nr:MAG: ABC transporter substrate-binding protein [Arachnia propionica]